MVNQLIGNHGLGIFDVVKFDLGPLLIRVVTANNKLGIWPHSLI